MHNWIVPSLRDYAVSVFGRVYRSRCVPFDRSPFLPRRHLHIALERAEGSPWPGPRYLIR